MLAFSKARTPQGARSSSIGIRFMSQSSWEAAMAQLPAAQRDFMNGDASGLQQLYSHRDDVTVMGGFGGFERGWARSRPAARLARISQTG